MELLLLNTSIFESHLEKRIEDLLRKEAQKLNLELHYKLSVIFNVDDIHYPYKVKFYEKYLGERYPYPKKKKEDVIYTILSYQLE